MNLKTRLDALERAAAGLPAPGPWGDDVDLTTLSDAELRAIVAAPSAPGGIDVATLSEGQLQAIVAADDGE